MTVNRVTQHSIGLRTLAGLQGNLSKLGTLQQQLSSGKLISKPSDSPAGTVSAMQFRSQIRTNEQWSRNAQDGLGWLGTIDNTLSDSLSSISRARDLTVQGLNAGAMGPDARKALATEVSGLRASLIGTANTTYLGRPVFGGTTAGTAAYASDGTYLGTPDGVQRTAGDGAAVRVDVTGPEAFGDGATGLFAVLQKISDHLTSGDGDALRDDLAALDAATSTVKGALSGVGARENRLDKLGQEADDRVMTLKSGLSDVEDIDLPKTIVDLQLQNTAYQAALGATQRIITPSLADFLK